MVHVIMQAVAVSSNLRESARACLLLQCLPQPAAGCWQPGVQLGPAGLPAVGAAAGCTAAVQTPQPAAGVQHGQHSHATASCSVAASATGAYEYGSA